MSKCWNCGRLTLPWARTARQYVKGYYQGVWPTEDPPPGSFICGRCRSLVIKRVALKGGQLYHLISSPKDLALILRILRTAPHKPLDELLKDGLSLNPGSLYTTELISLVLGIINRTSTQDDLKRWGRAHGGWGCGVEASINPLVEKGMRILQYTPAFLSTTKRYDKGDRDVRFTSPLPYNINKEGLCILRITATWGFHGNNERGNLIVLPISSSRFLWFNAVERWSNSF